jgi:mRNA-degrading endonuclease RelE of RelBE toxin-antitoxin system
MILTMTNNPSILVQPTEYFEKVFKRLRKKYPQIGNDLKILTDQLEAGETPGDQIQNIRYPVYKARLRNTDTQRGKSGGYRVIYYVKIKEHIILLTVYTKTAQTDISAQEIRRLIEEIPPSE